jgi:hypothetical protein
VRQELVSRVNEGVPAQVLSRMQERIRAKAMWSMLNSSTSTIQRNQIKHAMNAGAALKAWVQLPGITAAHFH